MFLEKYTKNKHQVTLILGDYKKTTREVLNIRLHGQKSGFPG